VFLKYNGKALSRQASKQAKLKKTKKTEWVFIKRQPKTKYALMVL